MFKSIGFIGGRYGSDPRKTPWRGRSKHPEHVSHKTPGIIQQIKRVKILHQSFEDPSALSGTEEEIMAGFRRVRDEIRNWIENEFSNG